MHGVCLSYSAIPYSWCVTLAGPYYFYVTNFFTKMESSSRENVTRVEVAYSVPSCSENLDFELNCIEFICYFMNTEKRREGKMRPV